MQKDKAKSTKGGVVNDEKEGLNYSAKQLPPSPAKKLTIGPETGSGEKDLKQFLPVVEMVVKKEYKSIPSYLAEYSELINIGLISVNKLINDARKSKKTFNSSYIAQAVKWAIKDELRTKYNWYGVKQTQQKPSDNEEMKELTGEEYDESVDEIAAERVFENILSFEDFPVEPVSAEQLSKDELAKLEVKELQLALRRAISKLPAKYKRVMELRFFEGKRGNDVALELGVTPSRISHIIQDAIEKVRQFLVAEGYC